MALSRRGVLLHMVEVGRMRRRCSRAAGVWTRFQGRGLPWGAGVQWQAFSGQRGGKLGRVHMHCIGEGSRAWWPQKEVMHGG